MAAKRLSPLGLARVFVCRNMTMADFAAGLRGMLGAQLGTNTVSDESGLKLGGYEPI